MPSEKFQIKFSGGIFVFNNIFYLAGNRSEIWTYAYDPFRRRLSKERQDKLAQASTDPKRTHFVWDGNRLLQEYTYKGCPPPSQSLPQQPKQRRINTSPISAPTTSVSKRDGHPRQSAVVRRIHRLGAPERTNASIGTHISRSGCKNQCYDEETGLHYNLMRYYEPETGRFVKYF